MNDASALGLISAVVMAPSADDLFRQMQSTARALGFDHALFGTRVVRPKIEPVQHVASSYPADYQRLYQERGFIQRDPTVHHCQGSRLPLVWSEELYGPDSYEVMEESRGHGLGHGLSVAVHESETAKSMLSLARDRALQAGTEEESRARQHASVLAHCLHVATQRLVVPELFRQVHPRLSPRERECLAWVSEGKSDGVIGDILGVSAAAVHFHVGNLMRKLKVTTRTQAVAKAVALGLIR